MNPSLFKGIVLCVDFVENPFAKHTLKGLWPGGEEGTLLETFERCGGFVVDFEREDERFKATHVLAKHVEQQCYAWGRDHGKTAVNFLWLWDSLRLQKLFPSEDEIYQAFPGSSIAGAEGCYVTITGYVGHQRHIVQHTIESLGMGLMLEMKPGRCTHVISADVGDKTSRKLMTARGEEFKHRIKIVNTAWLYNCARNWDILPADGYLENLPEELDPVLGAPLMTLSDGNTVANTPEDSTGMSEDEGRAVHQSPLHRPQHTSSRKVQETDKVSEEHYGKSVPVAEAGRPHVATALAVQEAGASTRARSQRESGLLSDSAEQATHGVSIVPSDPNQQKGRASSTTASLLATSSTMRQDLAVRKSRGRSPCTPLAGPAFSSAARAGSRPGVASRKSSGTALSSERPVPSVRQHEAALPQSSPADKPPMPFTARCSLPEPAPIRAGGVEALQLFAPLVGSDNLFGSENLEVAEAITARLAAQLGPSMEIAAGLSEDSPSPPEHSSPAPGNVVRQGAEQARTPLTELLPGAFQAEGHGRPSLRPLQSREEAGGATVPRTENPMPANKAAQRRHKAAANATIKGAGRKGILHQDPASEVSKMRGQHGDPACTVKDVGRTSRTGGVLSAPGVGQVQEGGLSRGACRKLGPHKPLLMEPSAKPEHLKAARAAAGQKKQPSDAMKAGATEQPAEGFGVPARGKDNKQRPKRAREAIQDTRDSELPAAGPSEDGASLRTKRSRRPTVPPAGRDPALSHHTPQRNAVRGGDQTTSSARPPACLSSGFERHRPVRALVLLSGMHTHEQQQNLRALSSQGVSCIAGKCERWPSGVTHIVEPHLSRSLKSLAGMAAGAWLVSTAFVGACHASCGLAEPDNYELQAGKTGVIDGKAPRHWRVRHERLGTGAFQGLQVTFFGEIGTCGGPNRSALTTIIKAGGGEVCPLQHALRHGADLAIMEADVAPADANVGRLRSLQVTCATPSYIVEWLARPWEDLKGHLLFQKESSGNLALLEKQRGSIS